MGVPGLNEILCGGLPPDRVYLVDGEPGTGKTTLGIQFLLAGRKAGEGGMYVTLSETAEELKSTAISHGWDLDGIDVIELNELQPRADEAYTLFHPSEVELQETVEVVLRAIEERRPTRIVVDSLSEMRLLARDPLRFRRQILSLKQFFVGRGCTALLLDDRSAPDGDMQLHSLAHGVIVLEHMALEYGADRRRLEVRKLRGSQFVGGYHDFRICTGGLVVYPRLETGAPVDKLISRTVGSGVAELDSMLGGGLTSGTSTLVTGAAGTGKSLLCLHYGLAAAARGETVRFYLFDERIAVFRARAQALGLPLRAAEKSGNVVLHQIEPAQMSPGEFSHLVRVAVEQEHANLVVIDSINGYLQAMPSEKLLSLQVHELLSYLANHNVTSILTLVQRGIFGGPVEETAEVSYLADTVILLRYFEHAGAVRQAMSTVKKRSGRHERTIREFRIGRGGINVGEPLNAFRGVLTGIPEYEGREEPLMPGSKDEVGPRSRGRRSNG